MRKQCRLIWSHPVINNSEVNTIDVEVYYSKGGMNYFTGKVEPRGYYMQASPVKVEKRNGYEITTYTAFTGIKNLISETKRFGKKAFEDLSLARNLSLVDVNEMVELVAKKNNLIIE